MRAVVDARRRHCEISLLLLATQSSFVKGGCGEVIGENRPLRKILFNMQLWVVLDVSLILPVYFFLSTNFTCYASTTWQFAYSAVVYEHTMLRSSVLTCTLNSIVPC